MAYILEKSPHLVGEILFLFYIILVPTCKIKNVFCKLLNYKEYLCQHATRRF